MPPNEFRPYEEYSEIPLPEMQKRARRFYHHLRKRRSVRDFSDRDVPRDIIAQCIRVAGTAPSGANMQPWHFVAVQDSAIKSKIREAAETEEREFYENRAPDDWLEALEPLGTDPEKPFLKEAPWLIAIFAETYGLNEDSSKRKHYYVKESVGIATGILITAVHNAGLVSLTHTPSPMGFLNEILDRPENEKPFLLLVVGYPSESLTVPDISKKQLDEILTII
ncbi:MAG: nitroreductase family protein [Candidatus Marinimicrobia bacterium]|nr:nitroreductase family protein [Candidatus Neomarinimicrobiota bacterium]MCF7829477.1 nitroreductase family protein [Candidatus Neomarinimicrobiota bacterium]MCF7880125.1 nitroreductase family protein [Candidatus Neomarinimicrobiota bacterium]